MRTEADSVSTLQQKAPARETVLFVDDEPHLLEGLRTALRKEPYEILTASSAAKGLDILASRHVDVVVSDEKMPGMQGSEFLSLVRRQYSHTLRIILTGQASLDAAIRAINEGEIYRFLSKPCSPVEIAHTIRDGLLLKNLTREGSRLLEATRQQRSVLEELEREHPGITHLDRDQDGSILLGGAEGDAATLIKEMRMEVARGAGRSPQPELAGGSRLNGEAR